MSDFLCPAELSALHGVPPVGQEEAVAGWISLSMKLRFLRNGEKTFEYNKKKEDFGSVYVVMLLPE